ncbi:mboat family protein [Stylonychia lemnae]|uniref:O-acyltransferase n=1 Tax=Stylonychia lemnae TaxID=5949 RepID=A0A077ZTI1_STYLE|nr:mboat family protein [Stylonychia lemnae]|eukprot:CDW73192.1 mboat family protein [Stylonychia lemnae]
MSSVTEIETQLRQKNTGISEEARKALLDDVNTRIDQAKSAINQSLSSHKKVVNSALDDLVKRIDLLKIAPINQDGSIQQVDQFEKAQQKAKLNKKVFSQKIFVERDSLLTEGDKSDANFRTLENIFIAFLALLGIQICVEEYFENGNFFPGLDLFYWVFGQFGTVLCTLGTIYLVQLSAIFLVQMVHHNKLRAFVYIPMYGMIQIGMYLIGLYACYYYRLPPASGIVVSAELARVSMKVHAYFREKIINGVNKDGELALYIPEWAKKLGVKESDLDQPVIDIQGKIYQFLTFSLDTITEIKRFAYFFICPTLVYRDSYVVRRKIRWNVALKNLGTFLFLIFYVWSIFKGLCIPMFKDSVANPGGFRIFFSQVIFSTVSGIVLMLSLFYGILHCWFNFWGEIFKFGDRLFYEDWWNVKDFSGYYRKWNIVVHEFLYYYIYQDSIRFTRGAFTRNHAKLLVFFISAIIHEIIITCGFGFFFPILFLLFGGPGVIFTTFKFGNSGYAGTMFWLLMLIGSGIILVCSCREFYARQSPLAPDLLRDGLWAYLQPQSLRFYLEQFK